MAKKKIDKHEKALIPTKAETYTKRRLAVQPLKTPVVVKKTRCVTAAATAGKRKKSK